MSSIVRDNDIAIIGMSCRFPGADNASDFWENLRNGVESITFFSERELAVVDPELLRDSRYIKAAGVLKDVDKFDADFFGYNSKEAALMEPQQRLLLECAWEGLEDAGYRAEDSQRLIGVYVGAGMNTYLLNNVYPSRSSPSSGTFLETMDDLQVMLSNDKDFLATRISYKLGLRGPSINVQTACSTSLVAVHLACQGLLSGECDMALSGGVFIRLPQEAGHLHQEDMIFSSDGHCRAFDHRADGTVFSSGAGVIVLKLLRDAIADGDTIHAVIKGSAVNNDGAQKVGYAAPSVEGQARAIAEALAVAEVDPASVSYVEAHGTATKLGDLIEIEALTQAFRNATPAEQDFGYCAIGSVKTNIGHLGHAAGIAGLIKCVLALEARQIPPSLHFSAPNPKIDFGSSPFYVNSRLADWPADGTPRRAGVSSFGMGGTNAHVVLEEWRDNEGPRAEAEHGPHLLTLSAKTEGALVALARRYAAQLQQHPRVDLADVCFTANVGRLHFQHRLAVQARSIGALRACLSSVSEPGCEVKKGRVESRKRRIVFLFSGQGSQYLGMGRELFDQQQSFRKTLLQCEQIVQKELGVSLLSVMYGASESAKSQLDQTLYTQPALYAVEYGLYEMWKGFGVKPDVVMGHSVGEYVAASVAGVFSLEDGLKLVCARARLMQQQEPGAMLAVQAYAQQLQKELEPYEGRVVIAAFNAPQSVVISGRIEAVQEVDRALKERGVRTKLLAVSHGFHSPLMKGMRTEFETATKRIAYGRPRLAMVTNVTGQVAREEDLGAEYWARQVEEPVRFEQGVRALTGMGVGTLVEVGPKGVLLGLAEQTIEGKEGFKYVTTLKEGKPDWEAVLDAVAELYLGGMEVDFAALDQGAQRRRVSLPTYPFQRSRHWLVPPAHASGRARSARAAHPTEHPLLGRPLRLPGTQELRFEKTIDPRSISWIADHRLFGATILPGTAYVEAALAAGVKALGAGSVDLRELRILRALHFVDEAPQTIQTVLRPEGKRAYAFRLFSLIGGADDPSGETPGWLLHATGRITAEPAAELGTVCPDVSSWTEVPVAPLYERFERQGLAYGPSYRTLRALFRSADQAVGIVVLPPELAQEAADSQIHPALLDACTQVLEALLINEPGAKSFVPVGIERVAVYRRPGPRVRSFVRRRENAAQKSEQLCADFWLFNDDGSLIATVEGFLLKAASSETLLGTEQDTVKDWLYRVKWQPTVTYGQPPAYLPCATELGEQLAARLQDVAAAGALDRYATAARRLETFALSYVLRALQQMGWQWELGASFTHADICRHLKVLPRHERLVTRLLGMLAEEGLLRVQELGWKVVALPPIGAPRAASEILSDPAVRGEATLLSRCGPQLAEVLQGHQDPLQLLFPDGDLSALHQLYRDSPLLKAVNTLASDAVRTALSKLPADRGCRILEIGAGTGSATAAILPHLPSQQVEYVFTDISAFFSMKAQQEFAAHRFLTYATLDIERDPRSQGFAGKRYDLIVAANVLHATSCLSDTLLHVRSLLNERGLLIMIEGTAPLRWVDLTFGLTEGWWRFIDVALRTDHPLLPVPSWQAALQSAGFDQVAATSPMDDPALRGLDAATRRVLAQHVIVARADRNPRVFREPPWLILSDHAGTGRALQRQLRDKGIDAALAFVGEAYGQSAALEFTVDPRKKGDLRRLFSALSGPIAGIVHLWSLDSIQILGGADASAEALMAAGERVCESTLHLLQVLLERGEQAPPLWLVTCGAQAVAADDRLAGLGSAPIWGLAKVVTLEHPDLPTACLDLDPMEQEQWAAQLCAELSVGLADEQISYRRGVRHVARLSRHDGSELAEASLVPPAGQPFRLELGQAGVVEGLTLQPCPRRPLPKGQIEIRVRAAGLNFRDVLCALGLYDSQTEHPLGAECAGEVVAVGKGVVDFRIGDAVIAYAFGSFGQYVQVDARLAAMKPTRLSMVEAATIPAAFLTAYHALHEVARIKPGERVLIHSAAGGVGQAAIQLVQQAGAEVFATASPGKWSRLKELGVSHTANSRSLEFANAVQRATAGRGVDVVLNSLTGDGFIEHSLSALARGGRFLELSRRGVLTPAELRARHPNVAYSLIELDVLSEQQPERIGEMLRRLVALFDSGVLKPIEQRTFSITDAIAAFRVMQRAEHTGKIVLTLPKAAPSSARVTFSADGTYAITGGFGGLGLWVARWMVERGARSLILLGRHGMSAATEPEVQALRQLGAEVIPCAVDVADFAEMERLLQDIARTLPPLRGIIHAAGVLDDGVLSQLDWQRFASVLSPKVNGAWNLHRLTRHMALDFFVLFSSLTSLIGNAGQANHAAANAFLDTLASHRRAQGLPALSIAWGAWAEVGIAAERKIDDLLARKGIGAIEPHAGLQVLEQLMLDDAPQVGVSPIEWRSFLSHRLTSPRFFSLFASSDEAPRRERAASDRPVATFMERWGQAPSYERTELLLEHICAQVAKVLGQQEAAALSMTSGFFELGMDSLTAIEFRNRLKSSLGLALPATLAFDYPTLHDLAKFLGKRLEQATEQVPGPTSSQAVMPEHTASPNPADPSADESLDDIAKRLAMQLGLG